ncbi:UNVERIFIED_CONTAM: hypothetical protein RMT77_019474 [Armadillidium vulgare]
MISAFLFAGGSFCMRAEMRKERERREPQYMIPAVYQQKQYAAYGYGYPGGPYHYGTQPQYGHYNY